MADFHGGDLLARKKDSANFSILAKLLLAKKYPKLGIQLLNAGDDNQSCLILTGFFNRIDL